MDAEKVKAINKQERDWYVEFWAEYVKTHKDKEWGRQQNLFINSLMQSARQTKLTARQYLRIKNNIL